MCLVHEERVADRMNAEPAIFKGCSTSELLVIAVVATAVWLPSSLLISALLGAVTMGLGAAGVGIIASVVIVASIFQKLKAGRPDGFYQQRFRIWLADRGIAQSPFIRISQKWDLGRTIDA